MKPHCRNLHHDICWRALAWLVLILLSSQAALAASSVCSAGHLSDSGSQWRLPQGLQGRILKLVDSDAELSAGQVSTLPDSAFQPATIPIAGTSADKPLWLRLCIQRSPSAAADWVLAIRPADLGRVTLVAGSGPGVTRHATGAQLPFSSRAIPARAYAFPLELGAGTTALHLKLRSRNGVAVMPTMALPRPFLHAQIRDSGLYGLYLGMLLMVVFINAAFWWRLRFPEHGWYALAMFFTLGFSVILNGYAAFVVPDAPIVLQKALAVGLAAALVAFTGFLITALHMRLYYPWTHRLLLTLAVVSAVLGLLALPDTGLPVMLWLSLMILLALAIVLPVCLHAAWRHRRVRWFALALLPLELAMLLAVLGEMFGLAIGKYALAQDWPTYAGVVHMVVINLVLAQRAWQAQQGKIRAQAAALHTARRAEEQLEAKVASRTLELDAANTELQAEVRERKAAQQHLAETLDTQRNFMSMVTHEFRSPLTTIDMASEMLADQAAARNDHDTGGRIARVQRSVERMRRLMENCLAVGRLQLQALPEPSRSSDLRATLARAARQTTAPERIDLQLPEQAVPALHDPDMLGIAVANLIGNALKFSPADAPVHLRLQARDGRAVISVRDHGPGVAEPDRARLFERFYRAEHARDRPGIGLGLHLCRQIAEQHGGSIVLAPRDEGDGACFRIAFPLRVDRPAADDLLSREA